MIKMITLKTMVQLIAVLFSTHSFSQDLGLNQYLYNNNPTLKRLSEKRSLFKQERSIQSELILSPKFFSNISLNYSKSRNDSPLISNEKSTFTSAKLGVRKSNIDGSYIEFGYNHSLANIQGVQFLNTNNFSYTFPNDSKTYSGSPFFTFGMPLLAGSSGTITKNQLALLNFSEKIEYLSLDLEMIQKESQLKNLIWSYFLNTQLAMTTEESLIRVRRLYNIVKRKVDQKIEETGALYQVDAFIKSNEIELMNYKNGVDHAVRMLEIENIKDFTMISNILSSKETNIQHIDVSAELFTAATMLKIAQLELNKISGKKRIEEFSHHLDLILQGNFRADNAHFGKTMIKSLRADKPELVVALNFSTELDRKLVNADKSRQEIIVIESEGMIEDLLENSAKEIEVLKIKASNEEKIIISLEKLKNVQLLKLQNEMRLLSLGRSSLFQVLQFESEFVRSTQAFLGQKLVYQNTLLALEHFKFKY